MVSGDITIVIPSDEHIEELKKKGIDIEVELSRVVYDCFNNIQHGDENRSISMNVTQKQLHDLSEYGIDGASHLAAEFRKQMHKIITGEDLKEN